jgi:hypothetical protein
MADRVAALYQVAADSRIDLAQADVDQMADATLEYLCIWLAALVIEDRASAIDLKDIAQRVQDIDAEIKADRPGIDLRQLQKARADYLGLMTSHRRMLSRQKAIDAAMLAMPDQFEEIYQTIMTASPSAEVGSRLQESIARLRLEEEIESELASDLELAAPGLAAPLQRPAQSLRARPLPINAAN